MIENEINRQHAKALDAFYHLPVCNNCHQHVEDLTYLTGWDYNACEQCAAECAGIEAIEAQQEAA
jgi:hypothetical protein